MVNSQSNSNSTSPASTSSASNTESSGTKSPTDTNTLTATSSKASGTNNTKSSQAKPSTKEAKVTASPTPSATPTATATATSASTETAPKASNAQSSSSSLAFDDQPSQTGISHILVASSIQSSGFQANMSTLQSDNTDVSKTSDAASTSASITSTSETDSSTTVTTDTPSTITTLVTLTSSSTISSSNAVASSSATAGADSNTSGLSSSVQPAHINLPGVVVASVLGFAAFLTILFLVFRYCAPIRRRYDDWQERKRADRSYREAIDGVGISPDKFSYNGVPKASSLTGSRFYASEPEPNTRVPAVQGTGLGLGNRLSLLMQHSPFRASNSVPREINQRNYHEPLPRYVGY